MYIAYHQNLGLKVNPLPPPKKKEIKRGGNYGLKGMGEGKSVNEDDVTEWKSSL